MPYENKPNTGALFTNEKKTKDNQPDYTGSFFDGNLKRWALAGWKKTGKTNGRVYLSLSISEWKEKEYGNTVSQSDLPPAGKSNNDDLPF